MKQTAVEWLEDNIDREMPYREILMIIQRAKEMEKQQYLKILPYDLNELANECSIDWNGEVMEGSCSIYKEGFQKALELLTFKSE
jgi:hypothetical protein